MWNCRTHQPPLGAATRVTSGTVTQKSAKQNRCGNPSEPVVEFWYVSAPGFKGRDNVQIIGGAAGIQGGQQYVIDVK